VRGAIDAGATGIAVGRNVWQHQEPMKMAELLKQVVFDNLQVGAVKAPS
jgi:DhnA family fructose-bisphosphate aldolase class Ia